MADDPIDEIEKPFADKEFLNSNPFAPIASKNAATVVFVDNLFIDPAIASDDVDLEVMLKLVMLPGPTPCNNRSSPFLELRDSSLRLKTCETFQSGLLSALPSPLDIVTPDSESVT